MRNTIEFTIDDVKYFCIKYTLPRSIKLLVRLSKIVGEPLSLVIAGSKGGISLDSDLNDTPIGAAVKALTSNLDENQTIEILKDVIETLEIVMENGNRKKASLDIDFNSSIAHLIKVIKEVLRFQYDDFFGDLAAVMSSAAVIKSTPKNQIKAK